MPRANPTRLSSLKGKEKDVSKNFSIYIYNWKTLMVEYISVKSVNMHKTKPVQLSSWNTLPNTDWVYFTLYLEHVEGTHKWQEKVPWSLACSDMTHSRELRDRTGQRWQHQPTDTCDFQCPSGMHRDDLHVLMTTAIEEGLESPCHLGILHPVHTGKWPF